MQGDTPQGYRPCDLFEESQAQAAAGLSLGALVWRVNKKHSDVRMPSEKNKELRGDS
jgi:hypothetical protein